MQFKIDFEIYKNIIFIVTRILLSKVKQLYVLLNNFNDFEKNNKPLHKKTIPIKISVSNIFFFLNLVLIN